jgi:hypothetical protein
MENSNPSKFIALASISSTVKSLNAREILTNPIALKEAYPYIVKSVYGGCGYRRSVPKEDILSMINLKISQYYNMAINRVDKIEQLKSMSLYTLTAAIYVAVNNGLHNLIRDENRKIISLTKKYKIVPIENYQNNEQSFKVILEDDVKVIEAVDYLIEKSDNTLQPRVRALWSYFKLGYNRSEICLMLSINENNYKAIMKRLMDYIFYNNESIKHIMNKLV